MPLQYNMHMPILKCDFNLKKNMIFFSNGYNGKIIFTYIHSFGTIRKPMVKLSR